MQRDFSWHDDWLDLAARWKVCRGNDARIGATGKIPEPTERHRHLETPSMIAYSSSLSGLDQRDLDGFLAHWDFVPPEATLLTMLKQSSEVILAREAGSSLVCGYVAALSDRIVCGYISALEVRPEFRGRGIGTALLHQMTERLNVYGVYLSCVPSMAEFYASRGFTAVTGMGKRKAPK